MSGGAPLSPDTHELIKTCLCVQVIQGYGLTETTSLATVMDRYDLALGRVGAPATNVDIRLINWEEGNYRITDKPHPRGEIVIGRSYICCRMWPWTNSNFVSLGGDNVSPGYYKNPMKTAEDFFNEGERRWFRTGDIGELHADGVIKIIGEFCCEIIVNRATWVNRGWVKLSMHNQFQIKWKG